MQTTPIQQNQNPYAERVRNIAIRSNKKCQTCGYKLNISDTLQQHSAVGEAFNNLIYMLGVEFQLNQNEKEYLIQQSANWVRYNDCLWTISKIMDNRPPNTQPQQYVQKSQQQNTIQNQNQVVKQQPSPVIQPIQVQQPNVIKTAPPVSNMTLQQKTNALFERIKKQNEEMLKKNAN